MLILICFLGTKSLTFNSFEQIKIIIYYFSYAFPNLNHLHFVPLNRLNIHFITINMLLLLNSVNLLTFKQINVKKSRYYDAVSYRNLYASLQTTVNLMRGSFETVSFNYSLASREIFSDCNSQTAATNVLNTQVYEY